MKKILASVALFLTCYQMTVAQGDYVKIGGLGQILRPKDKAGSTVTEVYLDSIWRKATIGLSNQSAQSIDDVPIRYELRSNTLEIKEKSGVKVLDVKWIRALTVQDEYNRPHNFINGKEYQVDGTPLTCMIEVLSKGKISLYKRYSFWVKPPEGAKALGIGGTDETAFKENFLYYSSGKDLVKVPKKKKLPEVFGESATSIEKYIHDNKLNPSQEYDLTRIFDFYNNQKN